MAEEFKPNETTTMEAEVGGNRLKVSTRRVSEILAIVSMVALCIQTSFTYQLWQSNAALSIKIEAKFAELMARQERVSQAMRELACVAGLTDSQKQTAANSCRLVGSMP